MKNKQIKKQHRNIDVIDPNEGWTDFVSMAVATSSIPVSLIGGLKIREAIR